MVRNGWPDTQEEAEALLEKGLRYIPDVRPDLFEKAEEWRLYFAMIICHDEQTACLEKDDFYGALMAASRMVKDGGLV